MNTRTLPRSVADELVMDLTGATTSGTHIDSVAIHACRQCKKYKCPDRWLCDRLFAADETTWRMSAARRWACPVCGFDVRSTEPCLVRIGASR